MKKLNLIIVCIIGIFMLTNDFITASEPVASYSVTDKGNDKSIIFFPPPFVPNIDTDPEAYFKTNPTARAKLAKNVKKREISQTSGKIVQTFCNSMNQITTITEKNIITITALFEEALSTFIIQKEKAKETTSNNDFVYEKEFIDEILKTPNGKAILKKVHESYTRKFASKYNQAAILFFLGNIKKEMKVEISSLKSTPTDKEIDTIANRECLVGSEDFIPKIPGGYAAAYITQYLVSNNEIEMASQIQNPSTEDEYMINLIYLYTYIRGEFIKRAIQEKLGEIRMPKFLRYKGIYQTNNKAIREILEKDIAQ